MKTEVEYAVHDFGGDEIRAGFLTIEEAQNYIKNHENAQADWFIVRYSGFHQVKTERV